MFEQPVKVIVLPEIPGAERLGVPVTAPGRRLYAPILLTASLQAILTDPSSEEMSAEWLSAVEDDEHGAWRT